MKKSGKKIVIAMVIFVFAITMVLPFAATAAGGYSSGYGSGGGSSSGGWSLSSVTQYGLPDSSVYDIIENLLFWLLSIFGIVGILGFVISGIMYLLAAGNDGMITKAKKGMTYSLIGVVVGLAGVVVIMAVNGVLNAATFF